MSNCFYFQEDEKFLSDLFSQLTDEATPDSKRRDLVLFLKEFCNFSQNLQPQAKETFYKVSTIDIFNLSLHSGKEFVPSYLNLSILCVKLFMCTLQNCKIMVNLSDIRPYTFYITFYKCL